MYTLTFNNTHGDVNVQSFDDSSDAVNTGVYLQVQDGGYNTSTDWWYKVEDEYGNTVYEDECMRHFV